MPTLRATVGNRCLMNIAFLCPQGGQEVAGSESPPPPPPAADLFAPVYQPARGHQQNDLQQTGQLPGTKLPEPMQGGPASAQAHAGGRQAGLCLDEQSDPAGGADKDHQAKTCLGASSSLPDLFEEDGVDSVVEAERTELQQLFAAELETSLLAL
ncbi:hypothetical protein WISP_64856 [Willisornis vidua]|uniref:Uncharacterized protein n=1 Tax=Willisornis vidua TaxID=1566151 RepID=A0ABQ9DEI3_9PASS|nr:hypothetical protein WISP_64856 [Willisornis vidua]